MKTCCLIVFFAGCYKESNENNLQKFYFFNWGKYFSLNEFRLHHWMTRSLNKLFYEKLTRTLCNVNSFVMIDDVGSLGSSEVPNNLQSFTMPMRWSFFKNFITISRLRKSFNFSTFNSIFIATFVCANGTCKDILPNSYSNIIDITMVHARDINCQLSFPFVALYLSLFIVLSLHSHGNQIVCEDWI